MKWMCPFLSSLRRYIDAHMKCISVYCVYVVRVVVYVRVMCLHCKIFKMTPRCCWAMQESSTNAASLPTGKSQAREATKICLLIVRKWRLGATMVRCACGLWAMVVVRERQRSPSRKVIGRVHPLPLS